MKNTPRAMSVPPAGLSGPMAFPSSWCFGSIQQVGADTFGQTPTFLVQDIGHWNVGREGQEASYDCCNDVCQNATAAIPETLTAPWHDPGEENDVPNTRSAPGDEPTDFSVIPRPPSSRSGITMATWYIYGTSSHRIVRISGMGHWKIKYLDFDRSDSASIASLTASSCEKAARTAFSEDQGKNTQCTSSQVGHQRWEFFHHVIGPTPSCWTYELDSCGCKHTSEHLCLAVASC